MRSPLRPDARPHAAPTNTLASTILTSALVVALCGTVGCEDKPRRSPSKQDMAPSSPTSPRPEADMPAAATELAPDQADHMAPLPRYTIALGDGDVVLHHEQTPLVSLLPSIYRKQEGHPAVKIALGEPSLLSTPGGRWSIQTSGSDDYASYAWTLRSGPTPHELIAELSITRLGANTPAAHEAHLRAFTRPNPLTSSTLNASDRTRFEHQGAQVSLLGSKPWSLTPRRNELTFRTGHHKCPHGDHARLSETHRLDIRLGQEELPRVLLEHPCRALPRFEQLDSGQLVMSAPDQIDVTLGFPARVGSLAIDGIELELDPEITPPKISTQLDAGRHIIEVLDERGRRLHKVEAIELGLKLTE